MSRVDHIVFPRLLWMLAAGVLALCPSPVMAQLRWDATLKEYQAKRGETNAVVFFAATNISGTSITITQVAPSCHCTVPKLPSIPLQLLPGADFKMEVDVDIVLKWGVLDKTISVATTAGIDVLRVKVNLPEPTPRERNQQAAFVDRQAVFKGECAQCHLQPAVGKKGEELYKAICVICHESEHRAEMVPKMEAIVHPGTPAYWEQLLRIGKPGTFMPAFSKPFGGPLEPEQLASLQDFLLRRFPSAKPAESKLPTPQ